MADVAKRIIRPVLWVSLLLCIQIVIATVDCVPDPPAIQQRMLRAQSSDHTLENAAEPGLAQVYSLANPAPPDLRLTDRMFAAAGPAQESLLLRLAADSSPPVSLSI